MKIERGSRLVMIGDSITDAGRSRPIGEHDGLGDGYVRFVAAMLAASYPERAIRVLNTGVGGDTVRDLKARWQMDALDLKPDWVSAMIGTNDVWRQFGNFFQQREAVPPDEFEATYSDLIARAKPQLSGGMVLMTPFYVQPDRRDPMRARMDEYGAIVARLAQRHDCLFVDTQAAFDEAMRSIDPLMIAEDRVHPSLYGSGILARAFLKAVEFEL